MHVFLLRVVLVAVFLTDQQHILFIGHDIFEGTNGFFASYKKRHDHAGEDHDIAQGQYRQDNWVFGLLFEIVTHYFNFPLDGGRTFSNLRFQDAVQQ